jgi:hypothetical protein
VGAASTTEAAAESPTRTEAAAITAPPAAVTVPPAALTVPPAALTVPPAEIANVAEAAVQVRYNIEHDLKIITYATYHFQLLNRTNSIRGQNKLAQQEGKQSILLQKTYVQ